MTSLHSQLIFDLTVRYSPNPSLVITEFTLETSSMLTRVQQISVGRELPFSFYVELIFVLLPPINSGLQHWCPGCRPYYGVTVTGFVS